MPHQLQDPESSEIDSNSAGSREPLKCCGRKSESAEHLVAIAAWGLNRFICTKGLLGLR